MNCESFADLLINVANPLVTFSATQSATLPPEQVIRVQGNGLSVLELDAIEASPHIWSLLSTQIWCWKSVAIFISIAIHHHFYLSIVISILFSVIPQLFRSTAAAALTKKNARRLHGVGHSDHRSMGPATGEETKAIDLRKAGGSTPMRCRSDPWRALGPARVGHLNLG